ncbi:MAG: aspartate--ammonia ligase [Clostridia bacterium]|nr:aspartate--ammonia ligase [Clostridia bacterium]
MLQIPENYKCTLDLRQTQTAIKVIKDTFQKTLSEALNLDRITAPIIVRSDCGINDDLNGVERKVNFSVKELNEDKCEVVQSLAKWKRMALHRYGYAPGEGIYTDMNAIRRDDDMDNLHSIFVDQWDWERIITKEDRSIEFLKDTVVKIASAIYYTLSKVKEIYPQIPTVISDEVYFITSQELEDMYPNLSAKERENAVVKKYKTVFLMQIGAKLKSGEKHDGRAPDYDDWKLNGDLLYWNEVLGSAIEISSMGIRVDAKALEEQLKISGHEERKKFNYHSMILNNELPLTIGGGIGQSRLCLLLLGKAHVGEVQVSVWDEEMIKKCKENGITLL